MILIVAGGRDFHNYEWCDRAIKAILDTHPISMIISGGANGADELAEIWCRENHFPFKVYKADWKAHGKAAGPMRNLRMATDGDVLLAFWDKKSRGTKNMIQTARTHKLEDIHIFYYGDEIEEPQPDSIN